MKSSTMLHHQRGQRNEGFTLVELAIVLVIIGLIVGGVLVGQDLIKAAEVRAQVSQIEKLNAAVNTFRSRFNGIPGDIRLTAALGPLADVPAGTTVGIGDGNGLLEDNGGGIQDESGEISVFWRHLSEASLVDGSFTHDGLAATACAIETCFPRGKINRAGIGVYTLSGMNWYHLGNSTATGAAVLVVMLNPEEARNIDLKVDNGNPFNGQTIAMGGATTPASAVPDYTVDNTAGGVGCAFGGDATPDALDAYDLAVTSPTCQLRMRMN